MDEEVKSLLRRNLELGRENNRLLKKIRRGALIGNIMRLMWIAILVGLPVGLYYYVIQPYFNELSQVYQDVQTGVDGAQESLRQMPLVGEILGDIIDKFQGKGVEPPVSTGQ